MTPSAASVQAVVVAAAKSSSGSSTFIIFLVVIGLAGYFLLLRPQQQKARRQRSVQSEIAVGDEVLTIGGIVGTVLDIDSERVTIITGVDPSGESGFDHPPTRMVLVRNAVARKIEPVVPTSEAADDEDGHGGLPEAETDHPGYGGVPGPDGKDGGAPLGPGGVPDVDGSSGEGDQGRTEGGSKEGEGP